MTRLATPVSDVIADDAVLLQSFRKGDYGAFRHLVERHRQPLLDRLLQQCGDAEAAALALVLRGGPRPDAGVPEGGIGQGARPVRLHGQVWPRCR